MPSQRIAVIRRRMRQADGSLKRAMIYLADVMVTIAPQHPELAILLFARLHQFDFHRQYHLAFYRQYWGGSERGMWQEGELDTIINEAQTIPTNQELYARERRA